MCGIAPRHIHRLCYCSWDGGYRLTPSQIGDMTLDQIFFLLADSKNLRQSNEKIKAISSLEGVVIADKDGLIKGRSADGTEIKGKVLGKSKAARIREEAEARRLKEKEEAEKAAQKKHRRRGR